VRKFKAIMEDTEYTKNLLVGVMVATISLGERKNQTGTERRNTVVTKGGRGGELFKPAVRSNNEIVEKKAGT